MWKQYEKSSWGIVYRKRGNRVEILLLKWINSKWQEDYVIPKGHIEEGEIASQTAIRETNEETGLARHDLEIVKFITKLNYTFTAWYLKNSPIIDKDVYLFLIKYKGKADPKVQKEERFVWYKWVEIDQIKDMNIKFNLYQIVSRNKRHFK
jgi:8-oxo-dGTP pyrophosphatase MutT (NUDIX family)